MSERVGACACGCPSDMHIGEIGCPCALPGESPCTTGALREAAAWIAESIGYPIQVTMPGHPMPQALWNEVVNHIHADESGRWHGNTLDREGTESWLADEAGRVTSKQLAHRCTTAPSERENR